jgi:hypothetical protein
MQENFQYKNITIGTDPEFFIQNNDGKLISSIGIIEGTKDIPNKLKFLGVGFAIQKDNVLGEFNVPYAYSAKEITNNISIMKAYISGLLESQSLHPVYAASGVYDEDQLTSDEAKEFGCSPDYNAWTNSVNQKPEGATTTLRSCGVHVHLGYDNKTAKRSRDLIKAMDVFAGIPSIIIDTDTKRRSLYGKAGCFRHTIFGAEYRVLSGFFLSNPKITEYIFGQAFEAINYLNEFGIEEINNDKDWIIETINSGNVDEAKKIVTKYKINLNY